MHKYTYILSAH